MYLLTKLYMYQKLYRLRRGKLLRGFGFYCAKQICPTLMIFCFLLIGIYYLELLFKNDQGDIFIFSRVAFSSCVSISKVFLRSVVDLFLSLQNLIFVH